MINPIKDIVKWQKDAGNLDKPYDDFLESSFQIEEALEGIINPDYDADNFPNNSNFTYEFGGLGPKEIARHLLTEATIEPLSDVDRLDKACDAIVYAIGSIAKLGLDHHGITKALNIVNNANKAKLGMARDKHGKLLKPDNFTGPEVELAKLLSETRR